MKITKIFLAIAAIIMAVSLGSCTVEYRERHGYYHRDHDRDGHDHDEHR